MIIVPKYKFIFFKPMKVGGSAIEKTLTDYVDEKSLVTGGNSLPGNVLKYYYENDMKEEIAKNTEYGSINNEYYDELEEAKILRFHSHTTPEIFFEKIKNKELYDNYKTITVVRNPWEVQLSYYWFNMFGASILGESVPFLITENDSKDVARKKFENYLNAKVELPDYHTHGQVINASFSKYLSTINESFIDERVTDYMMYEKGLNNQFHEVFDDLIFDKDLIDLYRVKSGLKKIKRHYSFYYNFDTSLLIKNQNKKLIDKFGYKFEKIEK